MVSHVQAIDMHVCLLHILHVAPVPLHIASWRQGDDMTCSSQARCTGRLLTAANNRQVLSATGVLCWLIKSIYCHQVLLLLLFS